MGTTVYILIIALITIIIGLIINYIISKRKFNRKVELLQKIIVALSQTIENQNHKIKLSDDLKELLRIANESISTSIYELNYDLISKLVAKK